MKTKIVYCLVSGCKDYFYEQLLISLCSLRKHNPEAEVYVVCDQATSDTLIGTRTQIFNYDIKVMAVDVPEAWDNRERSRYLKTHLRSIISGDYLFIDTDTIISAPLDIVDTFTSIIGAVYDSHVQHRIPKTPVHDTEKWIWKQARKVGQNIEGYWHFNSGVFYVKDHPLAYSLYDKWAAWHKEFQKKDVFIDQLPLLLANKELGEIIEPLDPVMNCQAIWEEGARILPEARIIHYFPGQKKFILSSSWLLDPVKETGIIPCTIQRIIDDPVHFFEHKSQFIAARDVDFVESVVHKVYESSPRLYKLLLKEIGFYYFIKRVLSLRHAGFCHHSRL